MKRERIIEEMARLEGQWIDDIQIMVSRYGGPTYQYGVRSTRISECPNYLEDLNAVHWVLLTLDELEILKVWEELMSILRRPNIPTISSHWVLLATAEQLCEAILKAVGVWEDDR